MDNNLEQVKQSEAALIGAVLRGGSSTYQQVKDMVASDDFGIHAFGYAWKAIDTLDKNGIGIDTITVGDEMERAGAMAQFISGQWSGRALLSDLRSNGDPRHAVSYAENVKDYAVKRFLLDYSSKIASWSANGRRAKDIMLDVQNELAKITLASAQDEFTVGIKVAASEAYDETDNASQGKETGVKTGLIDLDKLLGSLKPQNLYIVAARPGQGKTALMLTIAYNAARNGKRVAIFSLEMSRAQLAQRLISIHSGIDLFRIIEGKLQANEWPIYTNAVEYVSSLPIIINDLTSINPIAIRNTSRRIQQAGGLDLVIVDYLQLADANHKDAKTREQEVSYISRQLKYLARELNLPVLAASQLSRELERRAEKRPILSDLRESGSLEQDAYAVMFIYRPDEYEKDSDKGGTAEIIIGKHRNGPVGSVETIFRKTITKFESASSRVFIPS